MKPVAPTLPVSQELFHEMVRLHVYGRTDEALAKELNIELKVVRAVRWGFQEQWDAAVEALIPSFTKEMVFQTVAAIHLLASLTTDTKELATLAHAEERHLRLVQKKVRASRKVKEETTNQEAAPTPTPTPEEPRTPRFTPAELELLTQLRNASPTNTHFLHALQQQPALYATCLRVGVLPEIEPPPDQPPALPPPPAPAARPPFLRRLLPIGIVVGVVLNLYVWIPRWREASPAPTAPVLVRPPQR